MPVRVNAVLPSTPVLRVGVPHRGGRLCREAWENEMPMMVSASAFWHARRAEFIEPGASDLELGDVALDSAGFTAMSQWKRKGRQPGMLGIFPWTLAQYIELAGLLRPMWWSQPDCCVEPEIAADPQERSYRIEATAAMLEASLILVRDWQSRGAFWQCPPVPVLQGWTVGEYRESLDRMLEAWDRYSDAFDPPVLVGVGSMCRRPVDDPNTGILAILEGILPHLPDGMKLHLFGVKGSAMGRLASIPQVASFDSMAWDYSARMKARREGGPNTLERRAREMLRWYGAQMSTPDL
jgi:hypothetical protein